MVPILVLPLLLALATTAYAAMDPMAMSGGYSVYVNATITPTNINGVAELFAWLPIPENVTVLASGDGSLAADSSRADGSIDARIIILMPNEVGMDVDVEARLEGSVSGTGLVQEGRADFQLSITGGTVFKVNGSIGYRSEYNPETNISRTVFKIYNAPLVVTVPGGMPGGMPGAPATGGLELFIDLYAETITDFSRLTTKTTLRLVVNAEDQATIMLVRNLLAMMFMQANATMPLPEPKYNSSRGTYYMEFSTATEQPIRAKIDYDVLKQSSRVESFESQLTVVVKGGSVNETTYNMTLSAKGGLKASLRGPIVVGNATVEKLDARASIGSNATHVYMDAGMEFDIGINDPYIAGYTVKAIVEMLSTARHGVVHIVAPEPGALMIDSRVVHEAVLTPDTVAASEIYYVYKGVVMSYYEAEEKRFTVLAGEGRVYARGASRIVVDASRTGRASIVFEEDAREARVYITKEGMVAVAPASNTEKLRGTLTVQVLTVPPEPLPEEATPLGPIVDVSIESIPSGGLMVTLPYQEEPASGEIKVAHYTDGEWVLLDPVNVDSAARTVTVIVEKLSPLTVVLYTPPPTTTATTVTTITATETTTTTTTTATTTTQTTTATETTATTTATSTTTSISPSPTETETETETETTMTTIGTTTTIETTTSIAETTTSARTTTTTKPATSTTTTTPSSTTTYTPVTSTSTTTTRGDGGLGLGTIAAIVVALVVAAIAVVLRRR